MLCCVQTCWLADVFPADTDECKQKRKRYLPDGGCGCVAFVHVGMIYLCRCVWTCWLADALPADMDECKQKRKNIYLPDGCGCVWTCWLADAFPGDADECK